MKIRPIRRAWIATLVAVSAVVAVEGCTTSKRVSTPQATRKVDLPQNVDPGKGMSTGQIIVRPFNPASKD